MREECVELTNQNALLWLPIPCMSLKKKKYKCYLNTVSCNNLPGVLHFPQLPMPLPSIWAYPLYSVPYNSTVIAFDVDYVNYLKEVRAQP